MTDPTQMQTSKKGMSKGCLVALIVVGVLIVMVVVAGIVCYAKKDELLRSGAVLTINEIKTQLAEKPAEGVDTVQVNRMADAFVERLRQQEVDLEQYGLFMQQMQAILQDEKVDSAEVRHFRDAMVAFFPDLQSLEEPAPNLDTIDHADSAAQY